MHPLLIALLGAGALYALKQHNNKDVTGNKIMPQTSTGISQFSARPSPQQPAQVYAALVTPPGASRPGGYVPAFGPLVDSVAPADLWWNQA